MLRRLLQGGMAAAISTVMLGATVGMSAAAPGGNGHAGKSHHAVGASGARPGWGCGDTNHVHTGPPGLGPNAVSPCSSRVSSAAATHLVVSAPASASAGSTFSFTVTALNKANRVSTLADTIHFISSDGSATLPTDVTLTNGAGSFSATLNTVGNQTITATDTANSSVMGTSGTIAVSAPAAVHFVVSAPVSATAGNAFNFTVTALNQSNNPVTSFADTIHFTTSAGSASLPANATLTNGTGTFAAALGTAGSQTITATDTSNASITGTSGAIAVSPAAATHFVVSAPTSASAGTAFSVTVTAQDQFNNTATSYAGTVHFVSSDAAATPPADTTLTNGTGTFAATLRTAGNQTISASDTANAGVTGTSAAILVS